jgi:hypothetical protein
MDNSRIHKLLSGGDLRSIGRVSEVIRIIENDVERLKDLVECFKSSDPIIRSRASDALEKISVKQPPLLDPFKTVILSAAANSDQQEVRWHVAQMLPRLPLNRKEIISVFALLRSYLEDRSVIVRVCALQAMYELSARELSLRFQAKSIIEMANKTGTPAIRARCRKLLSQFGKEA